MKYEGKHMKKFFIYLLLAIMIFVLVACTQNNNSEISDGVDKENIYTKKSSDYKDDQVLFIAQDRCDTEDDRDTVYCYNYKGELLNKSMLVGYYAKNGLAPAYDNYTGKVGYVNKDGVFVIEPKYEDASAFSEDGVALVKIEIETGEDYDYKYGYIDSKGEEVTSIIYDKATSFYNCGYALARLDKPETDEDGYSYNVPWKHFVIDKKGNVVTEIDIIATGLKISAVYNNYYLCESEDEGIIFNYQNQQLLRIKTIETDTEATCYDSEGDDLLKITYEKNSGLYKRIKTEKFNGKKFIECSNNDFAMLNKVTHKRVATTQNGCGYGVEESGKVLIPFEYDSISVYNDYYVAIKKTGENWYDTVFDIYDKDFKRTAKDLKYSFSSRYDTYGAKKSRLPNGYFEIELDNYDYEVVYGIIDYTGKVIVDPVFGRGISLCSYAESGNFDWN